MLFTQTSVDIVMFTDYKTEVKNKVSSNVSIAKYTGGNKLRTYKMFKHSYETEAYVKCHVMSRTRRSALAKFRCGVAPLRIETGRYEMIPYEERYCFNCTNKIESEEHVLLECPLYNDIRLELLSKIDLQHFDSLDNHEKVCHLLSDDRIAIYSAKACQIILTERRNFLYR